MQDAFESRDRAEAALAVALRQQAELQAQCAAATARAPEAGTPASRPATPLAEVAAGPQVRVSQLGSARCIAELAIRGCSRCLIRRRTAVASWYRLVPPASDQWLCPQLPKSAGHICLGLSKWTPCTVPRGCVQMHTGGGEALQQQLQARATAEAMARQALQRLLAECYGVTIDADWLQTQGVDTSCLMADDAGEGVAEADGGGADSGPGAGGSMEGRDEAADGSSGGAGGSETKRGGMLRFLGL